VAGLFLSMDNTRKNISKRIRFEVFKRDSFTCQYCGKSAPDVILHADHIHPVSRGGKNGITNLITACQDCNLGKSNRTLSDKTAAAKSKAQADILQERRNQIKMMSDWYREMEAMKNMEVVIVEVEIASQQKLNDRGRRGMAARLKKYGLKLVLEKVGEAFSSDPATAEDYTECLDRLDKLLRWGSVPFHAQRANYITGVIRNKYPKKWDWHESFKRLLLLILEPDPSEHHKFYKIAANSESIMEARDKMIFEAESLGFEHQQLEKVWNQ